MTDSGLEGVKALVCGGAPECKGPCTEALMPGEACEACGKIAYGSCIEGCERTGIHFHGRMSADPCCGQHDDCAEWPSDDPVKGGG